MNEHKTPATVSPSARQNVRRGTSPMVCDTCDVGGRPRFHHCPRTQAVYPRSNNQPGASLDPSTQRLRSLIRPSSPTSLGIFGPEARLELRRYEPQSAQSPTDKAAAA